MKELFKDLFRSILEAGIRFWNNRFLTVDSNVEFLKREIEKLHIERNKLIDAILELSNPPAKEETQPGRTDFKPIGRPSWRQRAAQLENEYRQKRVEMDRKKAEEKITVGKSIEELEKEVGIK